MTFLVLVIAFITLTAHATLIEFDLNAVASSLGDGGSSSSSPGGAKRAHIDDADINIERTYRGPGRRVDKRQAAGTPCGGHDYLPLVSLCTPARLMPNNASIPSGTGKVVFVVGERGIANGVANMRQSQGAQVTVTATEINPQRRAALGMAPLEPLNAGIALRELDYGEDGEPTSKSPEKVVHSYMREHDGYLPDEIYLVGNKADSGNPEDYTLKERLYYNRVHHVGWQTLLIEFGKYRLLPQNANRTINVVFMISAGAYSVTPGVLEDYYSGHKKKLDYVRHQNIKKLLPNWRFATLAGFFINTTYYLYTRNPSADLGDKAQQEYLNFTIGMTLAVGNSVQQAAIALIQVATRPLGSSNQYAILPGQLPVGAYVDWSAGSFRTLENNLVDPLYSLYATGGMAQLQIHINQHGNYSLPAYGADGHDW
jgi:hypothetical protein